MLNDIQAMPYFAFAPSNIALVKYWGKAAEALQWPANDSLSMTFSRLGTATGVTVLQNAADHDVTWQGKAVTRDDQAKIFKFCDYLIKELGKENAKLRVVTTNNFPSDAGIASSASGFAALTLTAISALLEGKSFAALEAKGWSLTRIANLARMGSGSACRSLHAGFVHWQRGATPTEQTVVPVATPCELAAFVVVVDPGKKAVSSRDAHRLAPTSPLFSTRVAGIPEKIARITTGLRASDFAVIGAEIEQEALEMHCVAMTSQPEIHYLKPESWAILQALRSFRLATRVPAFATIDAGPNIHVLTPKAHRETVQKFLQTLPHRQLLCDETGSGAQLLPSATFLAERFAQGGSRA